MDSILNMTIKELGLGLTSIFNGEKWGVIDCTKRLIIPYKYDTIELRQYDDLCFHLLCGYDGIIYTGNNRNIVDEEVTIFTGVYDLYDIKGTFLLGGFSDYEYNKTSKTFQFLLGREWTLYPKKSTWEYNRFSCFIRGKWLLLSLDFCVPFNYRQQYVNTKIGYPFTTSHSLLGGQFKYKDKKLLGQFKGYDSPISFPEDILFDKVETINTNTIIGYSSYGKRCIINIEAHKKSALYSNSDVIDEHYSFIYQNGLGLLRDGQQILSCNYEYITKPVDGWVFVVKRYPYIPDSSVWGKYFVLLWDLKKYKYDFQIYKTLVAIDVIEKDKFKELLYKGAFKLIKVGDDVNNLNSYTLKSSDLSLFKDSFVDLIQKPRSVNEELEYNYWQSAELMKEEPKPNEDIYDHYSLMDALDGDPSAYWNIE